MSKSERQYQSPFRPSASPNLSPGSAPTTASRHANDLHAHEASAAGTRKNSSARRVSDLRQNDLPRARENLRRQDYVVVWILAAGQHAHWQSCIYIRDPHSSLGRLPSSSYLQDPPISLSRTCTPIGRPRRAHAMHLRDRRSIRKRLLWRYSHSLLCWT